MQRVSFKFALVLLGFIVLSSVFIFGQKKDTQSQGAMPGTFPLRDQDSAIAVGRTVAAGDLAKGFKAEDIQLVSIEAKGSQTIKDELKSERTVLDKYAFVTKNSVWVVTFSGHFTPKRYPKDDKPVYSTFTVYLRAENGDVLGTELRGGVRKNAPTPYPGIDE